MGTHSNIQGVIKGSAIIFLGIVIENSVRLLLGFILARQLGPERLGLFQISISIMLIISAFSMMGSGVSLNHFIPVLRARNDNAGLLGLTRLNLAIPLVISLILSISLVAFAPYISLHIYNESQLVVLLKVAALIVPGWVVALTLASSLLGHQKPHLFSFAYKVCMPITRLVAVIFLIAIGSLLPVTALLAFAISVYVAVFVLYFYQYQLVPVWSSSQKARYEISKLYRFAIPVYFSNLVVSVGPYAKIILIGILSTSADVGIYTLIYEISLLATVVYSSITLSAAPKFSEIHYSNNRQEQARFYKVTSKLGFSITLPLLLIIIIFPEPIMSIFGEKFGEGSAPLRIMAVAGVFNIIGGMSQIIITMSGKSIFKLVNDTVLYSLMLGFDCFFIPLWGIQGAAYSFLISSIFVNLICLYQVYYLFGLQPFSVQYLRAVFSGAVAIVCALLLYAYLPDMGEIPKLIISIPIFLSVYTGILCMFPLSDDERELIESATMKVKTILTLR